MTPEVFGTAEAVELAVVERSGFVESRHAGSAVVLGPDGAVAISLGAPEKPVFPRSSLKPFQAVAVMGAGVHLEGAAAVLATASHAGTPAHISVVRGLLAQAQLTEDALLCPADWPLDTSAREAAIREGAQRSPVFMNCSGKHAAMLLAAAANGWTTDGYLDPEHPVQVHVRETMAALTGVPVGHDAVDGCGAPLFGTSVRGVARAFGRLVLAVEGTPERAVADAMREHPFYVGGSGHQNSTLMETVPGALAKGGAEGVIGVAAADGTAVAMKVVDGSPRATTLIALRVLEALGTDISGASALVDLPVLGGGVPVGRIELGADLAAALEGVA